MEIYQLRTFIAVAEAGNLTRASERLFTSQPAVSAQIKALEEEAGVKLFDRTAKGMVLTVAGQTLKLKAEAVLEAAQAFSNTADQLQTKLLGEVKIGVNTDGEFLRISAMLGDIKRSHAGIKLQFIQDISGSIVKKLISREYDCGFFFGENQAAELETELLAEVNVSICAGIAMKDQIVSASWDELVQLPWIYPIPDCPYRQILARYFDQYGSEPIDAVQASSEDTMNALIRSGDGVSLMREDEALHAQKHGEVVIWNKDCLCLPLYFSWHRSRRDDPVIQAVRKSICIAWHEPVTAALDVIAGGKQ